MTLEPVSGGTARRPREVVDLKVSWSLDGIPVGLRANLFWATSGKGTPDRTLVTSYPVRSTTPQGEAIISITLPNGPYSFSGKLISLAWAVELALSDDLTSTRWDFVLAPEGTPISLMNPVDNASKRLR